MVRKGSTGRKKTLFKKGHTIAKQYWEQRHKKDETEAKPSAVNRNLNRPAQELYDLGLREHDGPMSILRPKPNEADHEVENAKGDLGPYITSNRIVSMEEFSKVMTEVCNEHQTAHPKCKASLKVPQQYEAFYGLGSTVRFICENCSYISSKKRLFEAEHEKRKGPITAVANKRLAQWVENTSISLDDIRLLFSILDMHAPGESTICRYIKKVDEAHTKKGEEQINKNRKKVSDVLDHTGGKSIVASDTAYNNVPKGRNMYQPGTQTCTPTVDMTTKTPIIISMETRSQHCPHRKPGQLECSEHDACLQTHQPWVPMADVEKEATKSFYTDIKKSVLNGRIGHHLADGCKTITSELNNENVEKLLCTQHVSRSQRVCFYKKQFSETLLGKGASASYYKTVLINTVVDRCAKELRMARNKYPKNDDRFYQMVEHARMNIVNCLQGDHDNCNKHSLACRYNKDGGIMYHGQRRFNMETSDIEQLQDVINYKLEHSKVVQQRYLLSTNCVEALHLSSFKLCPKSKTYTATHRGRHLNVVLLQSLGLSNAVLVVGRELGYTFGPQAVKVMQQIRSRQQYHKERKRTMRVKRLRHSRRNAKVKIKHLHKLKIENASHIHKDHAY